MVISKFHSKRKAKSGKRRPKKRRKLERNENVVEGVASVSNIVFDEIQDETVASKRKLLLNNAVKDEETKSTGDRNILISESILQNVIGVLQCPNCNDCQKLKITTKDNAGFSLSLSVYCSQCGEITCEPENSVNVNQRIVIALRAIGAGRAQLNTFGTFMNLGGLCKQTFSQIMKSVHQSLSAEVKSFLDLQMNIIRQYYLEKLNAEVDAEGILDITVSFDGTWHRRGHQSNHGIGFVIEVCMVINILQ